MRFTSDSNEAQFDFVQMIDESEKDYDVASYA